MENNQTQTVQTGLNELANMDFTQTTSNAIHFTQVDEDEFGKVKSVAGMDLIKVGNVSRNKVSVFVGKYCHVPSISIAAIKATFNVENEEAAGILQTYFTDARNAYIRERIIEGMGSIPATLVAFEKRNLWLAFNGVSQELAQMFIQSVIQTRCEEFAFMAASKKLGFSSLEEVPAEKENELIQLQAGLLPQFLKAASSERNKTFLLDLVVEGRILSRYGKLSEAQITEARKWIAGVDSPLVARIEELLNARERAIKEAIANVGKFGEGLDVMAEYFKTA